MTNIERQIADRIARANGLRVTKLGLRFDRVVVGLMGNLRTYVERVNLNEGAVLLTITAPIKLPAKTEDELKGQIKDFLDSGILGQDRRITIFQNEVCLRIVERSSKKTTKFVGLVHNPGTDIDLLLKLASQWLIDG
jgi:hypothetical protein